jgi:hypothetical protein
MSFHLDYEPKDKKPIEFGEDDKSYLGNKHPFTLV